MREYKNVTCMTDRELRICKKQLRRRILNRRRRFAAAFTFCLIAVLAVSVYSFKVNANTEKGDALKYYTCIEVRYGETLQEIAQNRADLTYYKSVSRYMDELRSINHINERGDIRPGQLLVVPYYK